MINSTRVRVIGVFLHLYREEKSLKQDTFARELGISRATLSYIEDGRRQPTIEHLIKISDCCNVCVCSLLGRKCAHISRVLRHEPASMDEITSAAHELLSLSHKEGYPPGAYRL